MSQSKWLESYRTPNTLTVALIAGTGTWVYTGAIQGQEEAIEAVVRSRRPIAAVGLSTVGRRVTEDAGVEEVVGKTPKL